MLSQDLTRYVDLHRSVGFKFRIQHSVLRNFVAFAEAQGDQFVRVTRVLDWAARAPSPPQRRDGCSRSDASPSPCRPKISAMRYRQPMPSGAGCSNDELHTSTGRMRSPA